MVDSRPLAKADVENVIPETIALAATALQPGLTGLLTFRSEELATGEEVAANISHVHIMEIARIRVRVTMEPGAGGKHRSLDRFMPDGQINETHGGWWGDDPAPFLVYATSDQGAKADSALQQADIEGILDGAEEATAAMISTLGLIVATVAKFNGTNMQLTPATGHSYAIYADSAGAMNIWGGNGTGVANPSTVGTGTGITLYGRLDPTWAEEIKVRYDNKHPLWLKVQEAWATNYGALGTPTRTTGFWFMDSFSLVGVDIFQCRAISAGADGTRMRVDNGDITLGEVTSAVPYEINMRNDAGYLQIGGGTSQASGAFLRLYGGTTGTASTNAGLIYYANNVQQLRYRLDLQQWDFKTNSIIAAALAVTGDVAGATLTTTGAATIGGAATVTGQVTGATFKNAAPGTVASLPSAATAGKSARHFVTDANATTFNSVVAGGGANNVPVFSDGTNWRIG